MSSTKLVREAAALREQGHFQQAIELVETRISECDDEIARLLALLQAFYAAIEANDEGKAAELAKLVAAEDPDVPSIQKYLA